MKGVSKSMDNAKKKLPIGIESFEEMITRGYYYIDKTREDLENR